MCSNVSRLCLQHGHLAANEPVQSSDYTSGLERRLTVPFIHQAKSDRTIWILNLSPIYQGCWSGVLAMPYDQVTALVRNTSSSVRSLAKWRLKL